MSGIVKPKPGVARRRIIAVALALTGLMVLGHAVRALAQSTSPPRTGQTICTDTAGIRIACVGTGQDGEFKAGVPWPATRFVDNLDGTVSDGLTGLMWTGDGNVMAARDPGFDIDGVAGDGAVFWQTALDYVASLNAQAYLGYVDWRLPNRKELIFLLTMNNPLVSYPFTNRHLDQWTSSTDALVTTSAWAGFQSNLIAIQPADKATVTLHVWPVRDSGVPGLVATPVSGQKTCYNKNGTLISCGGTGQDGATQSGSNWPSSRFVDQAGTINDALTGLSWSKDANVMLTRDPAFDVDGAADGMVSWQNALNYVALLNQQAYLGYADWRLPNYIELDSLVDAEMNSPSLANGHPFTNPTAGTGQRWSGTSSAGYLGAWSMDYFSGGMVGALKTGVAGVWPVRGGIMTPNAAPVLGTVTGLVADEGTTQDVALSAADVDQDILTFASPDLPPSCGILNLGNNNALLSCTWDFYSAGSYPVTIVVDDSNGGITSQVITLTVNNVNQAPVVNAPGAPTMAEGTPSTLVITAADPDGDTVTLTATALPAQCPTFTDNGDNTATLGCTWGYQDAGPYDITVTATDPGTLSGTATFTLTVTDTNRAPLVDPVANQVSDEGTLLEVPLTASDPDGDAVTLDSPDMPASCSIVGTGPNAATLSCQWAFTDAGVYPVTITADDAKGGVGSTAVTLTVNNVNAPPVLDPVPLQKAREDFPYTYTLTASDVDGEIASFAIPGLPTACTLTDHGDNTAALSCGFVVGDAGDYPLTATVTDPNGASASQSFTLRVSVRNRPPVFNAVPAQTTQEGTVLLFDISATDVDGDVLKFSTGTANCSVFQSQNQVAKASCLWGYYGAGTYNVAFLVDDGYGGSDTLTVPVTVENVNGPPVIDPLGVQYQNEGVAYSVPISAVDPDNDAITYQVRNLPGPCSFSDHLDGTATLDCTWTYDDSGNYRVTVTAKDPFGNSDARDVVLSVNNVNRRPTLDAVPPQTGAELSPLQIQLAAADPDGDFLYFQFQGVPRGMKFNRRDLTLSWTPGQLDAGVYNIKVSVNDGWLFAHQWIKLTIDNTNVAPTMVGLPDPLTASELSSVTYAIVGSDVDKDALQFTQTGLPPFCTFSDNGDNTASLSCTPNGGDAGTYSAIAITVSDGLLQRTVNTSLVVSPPNTAPVLNPVAAQTVMEGGTLAVAVSGWDPDGDRVHLVAGVVPPFCQFTSSGGNGTFNCMPGYVDAGAYTASVSVTDGFLWGSQVFSVTVNDVNQPPVLNPIGDQSVLETQTLNVTVSGSDPDGAAVSFTAAGIPGFCTFADNTNGTGTLNCSPGNNAAGVYGPIVVTVGDGSGTESESFSLEVIDPNTVDDICDGIDNNLNGVVDEGYPAGNTSCGQEVPVSNDVVTVTFDRVSSSGDTNVIKDLAAPALPPGVHMANGTTTYEISVNAAFGQAEVCIGYIGALVGRETDLSLYHWNGTAWENITTNRDVVNDQVCGTTTSFSPFVVGVDASILVNLDTFSAASDGAVVELAWTTTAEIDNEGFNVLRSESLEGPYEAVNGWLIPAAGLGIGGADYTFADTTAVPGTTYYYLLEDVENTGVRTPHGPLTITVDAGQSAVYTEPDPVTAAKSPQTGNGEGLWFGGGCSVSNAPATWGDAAGTLLLFLPMLAMMMRRRRRAGRGSG